MELVRAGRGALAEMCRENGGFDGKWNGETEGARFLPFDKIVGPRTTSPYAKFYGGRKSLPRHWTTIADGQKDYHWDTSESHVLFRSVLLSSSPSPNRKAFGSVWDAYAAFQLGDRVIRGPTFGLGHLRDSRTGREKKNESVKGFQVRLYANGANGIVRTYL